MGFFSEVDIEIQEMIAAGKGLPNLRQMVETAFPMLRPDEIDSYFADDHDGDYEDGEAYIDSPEYEQPEWE